MARSGSWGVLLVVLVSGCARRPPAIYALRHGGPIGSRDLRRGAQLYNEICAACHLGRVNPRGYLWSPAQMRHQVREGSRLMPPIRAATVSDADLEAVLAFLSTIDAVEGDLPPPPDAWLEEEPEPGWWDPPARRTRVADRDAPGQVVLQPAADEPTQRGGGVGARSTEVPAPDLIPAGDELPAPEDEPGAADELPGPEDEPGPVAEPEPVDEPGPEDDPAPEDDPPPDASRAQRSQIGRALGAPGPDRLDR